MIEARPVADEAELAQILELQRSNLARNLDERESAENGFVTVEHTLDVLRRMHALAPSIIAKDGSDLAGYALVMPLECRSFVPVLEPMFRRLEALDVFRRRFYVMARSASQSHIADAEWSTCSTARTVSASAASSIAS